MTTREPAPTYREPVTYDKVRQTWTFDPHWLRWLNSIQTQVGDLANLPGGHTIEWNGTALGYRHALDFVGDGVSISNLTGRTQVHIDGGFLTRVELVSDVTTDGTINPADLTGLSWPVEPNSTYAFRWVGNVSPNTATTGIGFQIRLS